MNMAGNVETAPAATPEPDWLSTPLAKIAREATNPRAKWTYHFTLFFPAGVGGRRQQRATPQHTVKRSNAKQKTNIVTPNEESHCWKSVTTTTETNQMTRETRVITVTDMPFDHCFGK